MSTEKLIRSQAKKSLSGNWTTAVAGLFVLLAEVFLGVVFYSTLISLSGIFDDSEKLKAGSEPILFVILVLTFVFCFALTPFENGFYRLCYNIAIGRGDGLRDVFYFFSGTKQYFKALQFNIIITLKKALYALIGFAPYIIFSAIRIIVQTSLNESQIQMFGVIEAVLSTIGAVASVIISIRLIIPEFVFVDNFEANVFGIAKVITKKHLKDYYKLIATFLAWILSCIFVLPGLYVIPYLTTSLGTTSKWLINMYKEGKTV